MVLLSQCRIPSENMPNRPIIRLYNVARSLLKGFPARLLGAATADTASVYSPLVGERRLSFYPEEGAILDRQTGSTWSPGGLAVGGQLKGSQLEPLPYAISFWFSWVAFYPDTDLRLNE